MITVFTPTYNRAYSLPDLYKSLCRQTSMDFEWVVVNDGSEDDTDDLIHSFIVEGKINIRYFKKKNGGKHTAINLGVQKASGDLFFIVDSDDFLAYNAIEELESIYDGIKDKEDFAGISGLRVDPSGKKIGTPMPYHILDCSNLEIGMKYHIYGDLAEAYKTKVLRLFPFPEIQGEKFITESIVWIRIANAGYKLRYTDVPIYYCMYRTDGLSASIVRQKNNSPWGAMMFYKELTLSDIPLIQKWRAAINYWRVSPYKKDMNLLDKINYIGYKYALFKIIGLIAYLIDLQKMKN